MPKSMRSIWSQRTTTARRAWLVERLEHRHLMANDTVTIFAAGQTGQENMALEIDGQVVATWNNVAGNVATRQFQAFRYTAPSLLTPDRVRVAFTNDRYRPGVVDRNLVVDRIEIGSTIYQSEAPTVYSTGTWLPTDGVQPGFRLSEKLQTNGYFQYAVNTGSLIQIVAAGQVGAEAMNLQINGQEVSRWPRVAGDASNGRFVEMTYRARGLVSADQVRVGFLNDFYALPIDYNLRVDKIIIDGVEYETEAPSTLSTGSYVAANNAVTTGYWQSEWLNSNGYFQFLARPANPGNLAIESSVVQIREGAPSIVAAIVRSGGSDGVVSVQYQTNNATAVAGQDYTRASGTVTFNPGETRKTISIPILNDTIREAPETFFFVIENPTGGATLSVPRTATVTITDDDLLLPNFANFPSTAGLALAGSASVASNALRLTPNTPMQAGAAYYNRAIPINLDTSFQTQFRARVSGDASGADGFTFVVQNATDATAALGAGGGGLGYQGITRSLAIEFDTWQNADDPNNNHTSIWINGAMTNSLGNTSATFDINGVSAFNVWVDYNGDSDLLALFYSLGTTKPTRPAITVSVDLASVVGSQAYFGFTAGTGGASNLHDILSWSLNLNRPTVAPPEPVRNLIQETIVSGLVQPIAIDFSNDGRNLYIATKAGQVFAVRDGVRATVPMIDISAQVNDTRDRGLLDIAIHPNLAANPYIYLLFTYDPPQVFQNAADALAGPDRPGNRAGRLTRLTLNAATNYTTIVAGSEVVLLGTNSTWNNFNAFINSTNDLTARQGGLNPDGTYVRDFIPSDSESHTVGGLAWGNDGSLFVTTGDGASYNSVDARATRTQDVDSLAGKVLRIDPINGQGYSNNPFATSDLNSNRSKVYQLGLRNPWRVTTDPVSGRLFVGDVGWSQWEEINSAEPGANFGWPYFEGGNGQSLRTSGYENLAAAQAFYSSGQVATPAIYALNHAAEGINAIVMGAYYTGLAFPSQYRNNLFFNDLGQGIVRNVAIDASGRVTNVETFVTGAVLVVQIIQGPDGNLYYVDLDDGIVGRWSFSFTAPVATATRSAQASPAFTSATNNSTIASSTNTMSGAAPSLSAVGIGMGMDTSIRRVTPNLGMPASLSRSTAFLPLGRTQPPASAKTSSTLPRATMPSTSSSTLTRSRGLHAPLVDRALSVMRYQ